eukprot:CAMPEP_0174963216 /NCGR_PEP_ID=MMETSP0004_2-20121128/5205_1 /TAXON_ID=420556 /ORGANISM="Ochromonas sp., Strain CCMP1393" /LENGTH=1919 /DNA_ID=CAMNT_0016211813 /DNA_START=58 /DNA_END=5817 /DNA_ORIENTATION=-
MSIWGKISKPTANVEDHDDQYYFSTSDGQVVSADGSGYVIPAIAEDSVEKSDYVPLEFAQSKIQDVTQDSKNMREAYQKHLNELETYYRKTMDDAKNHYEKVIRDIKAKALRHLEIKKQLKDHSEQKLRDDLKQSEDSIDELRDSMASLNREYQGEVRTLKNTIADTTQQVEATLAELQQLREFSESKYTLDSVVHTVEVQALESLRHDEKRTFEESKKALEAQLTKLVEASKESLSEAESRHENDTIVREACREALNETLLQLEINDMKERMELLTQLEVQLELRQSLLLRAERTSESFILEMSAALLEGEEGAKGETPLLVEQGPFDAAAHERVNDRVADRFRTLLEKTEDRQARHEVEVCMCNMLLSLMESHEADLSTSFAGAASLGQRDHALGIQKLTQEYDAQLNSIQEELHGQNKNWNDKYDAVINQSKTKSVRDEVEISMRNMIISIIERSGSTGLGNVNSGDAVAAVNIAPMNDAERGMLMERIRQLELQLQQPTVAGTSSVNVSSDPAEAGGAAVVVDMEQLHQQEQDLSEQLAVLRSREANIIEGKQHAETSIQQNKEALAKLNEDKENCKNDIKEWSKSFVEANGREPNVQDKATVKDKYQRYKVLSAKVKDMETKVAADTQNSEALAADLVVVLGDIEALVAKMAKLGEEIAAANAKASSLTPPAAQQPSIVPISSSVSAAAVLPTKTINNTVSDASSSSSSTTAGEAAPVITSPTETPATITGPVARPPCKDAEMQTEDSHAMMLRRENTQQRLQIEAAKANLTGDKLKIAELEEMHEADYLTIEQLDEQILALRGDFETAVTEKEKIEKERAFLAGRVEDLVKEKRTDVVKRFEDEISALNASQSELNAKVAALTAEKVVLEARLQELNDRSSNAEKELKERDEREQKALEPKDEKFALKGQITKQREQIILKSKAATAGWDAAAHSDERLDVETEKAYKRGLAEERDKHTENMEALNAAIEVKEARITELMVSVSEMEKKVMDGDERVKEMTQQTEAMKLEVVDTIANLSQMAASSGGGSGGGGEVDADGEPILGPTNAELEAAREELDSAQDELVSLMERCEKLDADLELARKKNRVYEQLAAITGIDKEGIAAQKAKQTMKGSGGAGGASGGKKSVVTYDIKDVINLVKKSIVKGTGLWKSNRKDDCYDLYLEVCHDCYGRLLTNDLRNPLSDAINNGKTLGLQNKQRGAVVLRKALDKLLADAEKPNFHKAEEEEAAKLKEEAAAEKEEVEAQSGDQVHALVDELEQIENSFLEQGYTKESNPSNSSSDGTTQGTPREGDSAASLRTRAKNAEALVTSLKKQLATVMAAAAANASSNQEQAAEPSAGAAASGRATAAAGTSRGAGGASSSRSGRGGGADPAEVRKLNRTIKELENKLKVANASGGSGGGGGGGSGGDVKALQKNEKLMQKKLKDLETTHKRETKSIEMRATKAENALQKIESSHGTVVTERDKLKAENAKLSGLSGELTALRAKAEHFLEVEAELATKSKEYDTLADQFKKETALRKKYKNELEDLKGAIRVYARCRPMAKYELEKGCKKVVQIKDETSMKIETSRGEKEFEFDAVFGENSTQDAVFEDTKRLVESCMDGFNVCLFAYGQTGSGKTFTMTGAPSMPGLTPKAIDELFRLADERKHLDITVTTYFVELYNDNLVDLYWILDNKTIANAAEPPKLDIKLDAKKMIFIRNSVIKQANSPSELMDLFNSGNLERHTGATKMNAESSRSHSIFAIMVECYDRATKRSTMGKLSLVDLAGSERADKTGAQAERLKEAQNINKSLSALGDVIAALSEGTKFIPYRNNKLTQLMQDSLGGNAKTLMFVNFSPADYNADETMTSLMYAARVKKIVNNASKQAESEEVARLKHIIKKLQAGQTVDLNEGEDAGAEDEGPPPADDGKVYDGY